ncbi:hypothetical protein BGZ97_007618 [Linnemannia gamsii]|uniref:HCP-like protein n=1 Tax=Linnemannia gamsii TaxID=64522 RepID=A0A9P6RQ58_9FUNG|nr:hypothetical protein BGZ97_007618 [Linnemannia gamsii]
MASAFAKEFDVSKIASPATQASNTKNACDTEVRPNDRHSDRSPAEVRTSSNNPQQQEQHGSSQDNNGTSSRDPTDKALSQVPKSVSAEVATPALSKFFQSTLAGQRDNRTRQASQDAANVHIELDDNNSDWTDDSSSKRVDNDSMDNVQSPDIELQYKLAKAYENDHEGLTRSDESAMELYLKAANQDHAEAQVRMANYYREGFSDHKDHTNAFEWYMKAAIQGHTDASLSAPTNIPMSREGNNTRRRVQAIRPVYSTSKPTTPAAATDPDVIHIAVHSGDAGKEILSWEDIVFAFKDALNIRHGADILSLEPICFAAMPDVVLDVYVEAPMMQISQRPYELFMRRAYRRTSEPGKTSPPSQFTQAAPRSKKVIKPNRKTTVVDEEEESNFIIVQSQAPSVVTSSTNNNTKASYSSQPKASNSTNAKPSDNILPQHGLHFPAEEITDTSCRPRERYGTIHIGLFYELGQGVEKYSSRAAFWYNKAAHQGFAKAQSNLGILYFKGEGTEKNNALAM